MKRKTLTYCALTAIVLSAPLAAAETISVNGQERTYDLVVPLKNGKAAPVIVVLHGGKGNGNQVRRYSGMDAPAHRAGFVTVYPDGLGRQWNDGRGKSAANDVGFLDAIVGKLVADGTVDLSRIYYAGISNGGMMSMRMACESKYPVRGIGVVSVNFPSKLSCGSKPPVQFVHFVGTVDPLMPFRGGPVVGGEDRDSAKSAAETYEFFLARNGCKGSVSRDLPDKDKRDGTTETLNSGKGCTATTLQYVIEGGGHTWPGAQPKRRFLLGNTTQDISASEIIISEFSK